MGFPGTLHLEAETLEAVLRDLVVSLASHGFARAFVFSAHGGNLDALAAMTERLAAAAHPLSLVVVSESLTSSWHEASARFGVSAAASGQHAGEFETSIVSGIRPGSVARDAFVEGALAEGEAQQLFYPDLRANAPQGVVGDPRESDSGRAARYLEHWVDALFGIYEGRR